MAESTHRKDFFISYNHRDGAWAEWIAWELEESGYTTGIQAWDFGVGSNFVIEIDTALREAERVIAVLSPNYLESDFTASEWAAAFSNDPKGERRRLIPVRVQKFDVDGLLGQIVYIDLVGKDEKAAKAELLGKLRGDRCKPMQKPKFPAGKRAAFPGAGSNSRSQTCVKFEMVLSGTIEEANRSRVEAVVRHLQKLLRDPDLTLQEVRNGSIVLMLQCSQAGFDRLRLLQTSGQLNEVMGFVVEDIRALDESAAPALTSLLEDENVSARERLTQMARKRHESHNLIEVGQAHLKEDRFIEAVAAFTSAQVLAPDEPAVRFFRAQAYLGLGDPGKALEDAREFSLMVPKAAPKEMREAAANLEREAKDRVEGLRKFGPQVRKLRLEAASAYRADHYSLAESKLREAINICPPADKHELECELSIVLTSWAIHDVNEAGGSVTLSTLRTAEGRLNEAARLDPSNRNASSNLATVKRMKSSSTSNVFPLSLERDEKSDEEFLARLRRIANAKE